MDNLKVHKVAGVRDAIEAVGAELRYLPEYSPDLNPIEMAFSRLKATCAGPPSAPPASS
jgi:transposase